jgi:hypothetical protein
MMCPMCGNEADDHTHELTSRFIAYMTEEITRLTAAVIEDDFVNRNIHGPEDA